MAWVHGVAAEVVDQAFDALVAPDDGGGGRCEMEIEDLDGDGRITGTVSGAGKEVGEEFFHVSAAVNADAKGVLPDDVVGVGGDNFFGVELVPSFLFMSEDGADGGFVGGLLGGGGLGCEGEDGDDECDGETEHCGSSEMGAAPLSEAKQEGSLTNAEQGCVRTRGGFAFWADRG